MAVQPSDVQAWVSVVGGIIGLFTGMAEGIRRIRARRAKMRAARRSEQADTARHKPVRKP